MNDNDNVPSHLETEHDIALWRLRDLLSRVGMYLPMLSDQKRDILVDEHLAYCKDFEPQQVRDHANEVERVLSILSGRTLPFHVL